MASDDSDKTPGGSRPATQFSRREAIAGIGALGLTSALGPYGWFSWGDPDLSITADGRTLEPPIELTVGSGLSLENINTGGDVETATLAGVASDRQDFLAADAEQHEVFIQSGEPSSPSKDDLWIDTS